MTFRAPTSCRWAFAAAIAAALALSGCGRKGDLDPPPSAIEPPAANSTSAPAPGSATSGQPVAPRGPNKRIPLDVLID